MRAYGGVEGAVWGVECLEGPGAAVGCEARPGVQDTEHAPCGGDGRVEDQRGGVNQAGRGATAQHVGHDACRAAGVRRDRDQLWRGAAAHEAPADTHTEYESPANSRPAAHAQTHARPHAHGHGHLGRILEEGETSVCKEAPERQQAVAGGTLHHPAAQVSQRP